MTVLDSERLRRPSLHDNVPIIEHPNCSGTEGIVIKIVNPNDIQIRCLTCQSTSVFVDRTILPPPVKS